MKTSVLFIKNGENNYDDLINTLELGGYQLHIYSFNNEILSLIERIKPDLILSDLEPPEYNGFKTLHLVRKNEDWIHIPFLFISSSKERKDFRKAMEMGAEDFITKPYSALELLNAIETQLDKRLSKTNKKPLNITQPSDYSSALENLLQESKKNFYKQKEIVFHSGNHPYYLFYVKSGMIKAFKTSSEGKDLIVQLYGPGDFVGYIALLSDQTYQITAQALKNSELLLIPKESFFDLIHTNTAFSIEFIKILAKHNNQKADQMIHLAYNSLRKRVAQTLLLIKDKYADCDEKDFTIKITREELANISGTTTESLIRTISYFKEENLIKIQGRSIKIINEEELMNLPN